MQNKDAAGYILYSAETTLKKNTSRLLLAELISFLICMAPMLTAKAFGAGNDILRRTEVYSYIVSGPLKISVFHIILNLKRGLKASLKDMYFGFSKAGVMINSILLNILAVCLLNYVTRYMYGYHGLIIVALFFLFVKSWYSICYIAMTDDPSKNVLYSMMHGWDLMRTNLVQYVLLCVCFVPLYIILYLPSVLLESGKFTVTEDFIVNAVYNVVGITNTMGAPGTALLALGCIGSACLHTAQVCFYDYAAEHNFGYKRQYKTK